MSLKIFVDDLRDPPNTTWHLARTITEAIRILATQDVTEVSLDYDIIFKRNKKNSSQSETFEPVCRYIALRHKYRGFISDTQYIPLSPIQVYCHSANPLAVKKYSNILGYPIKQLKQTEEKNDTL